MFPFYSRLGSDPVDAQRLRAIDDIAINQFKAAYSQYVKAMGTHAISAVSFTHALGDSEAITIHTLHVHLAAADQSLLVVPIIHEENLDEVHGWLEHEFDEVLECFPLHQHECDLIVDGDQLWVEEEISVLSGMEDVLDPTVRLSVQSSRFISKAFAAYERSDPVEDFSEESAIESTITAYAFFSEEVCDACDAPIVIAAEIVTVANEESGDGDRMMTTHHFHEEEYHAYCLLLSHLCHRSQLSYFVSLNHIHSNDEDMTRALAALHKEEIEAVGSMVTDVVDLLHNLAETHAAEEEQDGKRTLH